MQKVYISSTSRDTDLYRKVATESAIRMGMFPVLFEDLPPGQSLIDTLRAQLAESDIFVGIYAYRYGHIPEGSDKSLIHLEYDWAKERGIPRLLFVLDPPGDTPTPPEFVEPGKEGRLKAFLNNVLKDVVVSFFHTPEELQTSLVLALANAKTATIPVTNVSTTISLDAEQIQQIVNQTLDVYEARQRVHDEKLQSQADNPDAICVEPVFGKPRKDQQYFCNVFMIMPFDPKYKPIYEFVAKPVCKDLALVVKRGDDFFAPHNIMDEIWTAIYRSELVIVDCTENRPNVFYELGIAHALGKPAILITQSGDKMPFDINARRFIPYTDTGAGFEQLKADLKDAIVKILNKQA